MAPGHNAQEDIDMRSYGALRDGVEIRCLVGSPGGELALVRETRLFDGG
jgi:hypothetical protein